MTTKTLLFILLVSFLFCVEQKKIQSATGHNLEFHELAQVWDEAIPLRNGMVGTLIWQKEGKLVI